MSSYGNFPGVQVTTEGGEIGRDFNIFMHIDTAQCEGALPMMVAQYGCASVYGPEERASEVEDVVNHQREDNLNLISGYIGTKGDT